MLCVSEVMVHPNHPLTFGDWIPRDVYTSYILLLMERKKMHHPLDLILIQKLQKSTAFLVPGRCRYQESSNGPMDKMGTCITTDSGKLEVGILHQMTLQWRLANLGMNEHVRNDVAIEFLVILGSWLLYTNKNIKESQAWGSVMDLKKTLHLLYLLYMTG